MEYLASENKPDVIDQPIDQNLHAFMVRLITKVQIECQISILPHFNLR